MERDAKYWIEKLQMTQHPEGGYFTETYRSDEKLSQTQLPNRYKSDRVFGTSIYFLLTTNSVSNFHRLNSDEIWHFHLGGMARIHFLFEDGTINSRLIGSDLDEGARLQVTIPRGSWFAAEVIKGDFILVGCTVSPGFEFEDFVLADQQELLSAYPEHQTLVERFTNK